MRRIALTATAFAGLIPTGCATVLPVAGPALAASEFSYTAGRASQDFTYPPSALRSAIAAAMDDLRIRSVRQTQDGVVLRYDGTSADDRAVTVTLRPNQGGARVGTRIGWFGDEPLSKALMDRIGVRLGTLPPKAVPVEAPSTPESNPFFSRDAIPDDAMLREQADSVYRDSPIQ